MNSKQHPQNRNLRLHYEPTYRNMAVNQYHGPLIEQYLDAIDNTVTAALTAHRRVIVIRADLRQPVAADVPIVSPNRSYMTKFFSSLDSKIKEKGRKTRRQGKRWHDTTITYAWCKEYNAEHYHHYHVAIFLNGDTFRGLGAFNLLEDSLFTLIVEAWASALHLPVERSVGLPHFANKGASTIIRGEPYNELFYWLSYFAKAKTKSWGDDKHAFGCSRNNKTFPA